MHFSLAYGALALLPQLSNAHFLFPHLMLNGVKTGAYEYVREHDNGFQPSFTPEILSSNDFRCNKGSWNHRSQPKTAKIYLSKAPGDVRDYDGSGDWFKVYQLGTMIPWNGTDQGWLTRDLKQFEFKLPNEIPAGQYLMRIEQMSIHQPYRQKEMYFQVRRRQGRTSPPIVCSQADIPVAFSAPTSTLPAATTARRPGLTIKFPGGYQPNDPAIQLDSWAQPPPTFAPMPGPALWPN
ncbi:hypothetical protein CHGG_09266 [Chaetomium globosum CBS 148.51]|uniref:lytic cellulose monooxygenase (C4-dehydrogenating) n=1 Tax=Chaetomium globosum (strain ATCC 6205 / CBS 148.51 / DSM 1962 / NBRC 6347 / NRRL 1970) TaxID=306901 RepID=Q2GRY8_CHAGB|nr:uncharacterized protein CHGG_09266 [Chaetomium globosum CBS 148.51]EAQ85252.1 hypothetical protein CHGG_09266 [Chaetomium globosum CBS 148.51]